MGCARILGGDALEQQRGHRLSGLGHVALLGQLDSDLEECKGFVGVVPLAKWSGGQKLRGQAEAGGQRLIEDENGLTHRQRLTAVDGQASRQEDTRGNQRAG